jgi:predicted ATPase
MNFCNQIRRIERLDKLLRTRSTGTPEELARRLRISQSQLYQLIKIMREELGAPIYYSRAEQSYCYGERVQFVCAFKEIKNIEV